MSPTIHECEECDATFLTELQLRGHTATHSEYTRPRGQTS